MTLLRLMGHDLRFQWRHGILTAYGVVVVLYAGVLRLVAADFRPALLLGLLFSDVSVLGFFFVGGVVLLEKSQGVLSPLFITPLRPGHYLVSKTATLTGLSLGFGVLLTVCSGISPMHWGWILLSLVLMAALFTVSGLALAMRARNLNAYFALSVPAYLLFTGPVALIALPAFRNVMVWHPIAGGWLLMRHGLLGGPVPARGSVWLIGMAITALAWLAGRWLRVYVIEGGAA